MRMLICQRQREGGHSHDHEEDDDADDGTTLATPARWTVFSVISRFRSCVVGVWRVSSSSSSSSGHRKLMRHFYRFELDGIFQKSQPTRSCCCALSGTSIRAPGMAASRTRLSKPMCCVLCNSINVYAHEHRCVDDQATELPSRHNRIAVVRRRWPRFFFIFSVLSLSETKHSAVVGRLRRREND